MKRLIKSILVELVALVLAAGAAAAQAGADARLAVAGDVPRPLSLSTADLKSMMRRTVTVTVEGRTITYAGVRAADVLTRAGAPLGRELRGEALATYVLATAKDGYQVVFSLGELDPAVAPSDILIADTADGQPLADAQGPFRIVAPHDQRAVRGVRMLQRLDVVSVRST